MVQGIRALHDQMLSMGANSANISNAAAVLRKVPPFYGALQRIATDINNLPYIVVNSEDELLPKHPVNRLLMDLQPGNPEMLKHLFLDWMLYGTCFAEIQLEAGRPITGAPVALHRFSPADVSFDYDDTQYLPTRVHINNVKSFEIYPDGSSKYFYLFGYAPEHTREGRFVSPIEPIMESAKAFIAAVQHCRLLAENSYSPLGVISTEPQQFVSDDKLQADIDAIMEFWEKNSRRKVKAPFIIEGKWQNIAQNAVESELIRLMDSLQRLIVNVLHFPPQYLGLPDSSTYRSQYETQRSYTGVCVIPKAEILVRQLGNRLRPFYPTALQDFQIKIDLNAIPAMVAGRAEALRSLGQAGFGLTVNEMRKMGGFRPLKSAEADTPLIGAGVIPLDDVGMADGEGENDNGGEGGKEKGSESKPPKKPTSSE